jgi:hypothetical protein
MRDGGGIRGGWEYQDQMTREIRVDRVMRSGVRRTTLGRGDRAAAPEVGECHDAG